MIIWLTALVLVGLGMLGGYLQGGIRAAATIVGLFIASFLAVPFSGFFKPVLHFIGLENPWLLDALAPVAGFLVVVVLAKVGGQAIHQKIEYFYRYKKESRFAHWERLNKRVGLCVGVLGGAIYFFLVSLVIYMGGYLTYQLSSGDKDSWSLRTLNAARQGITETHLDKVVAAHDPAPEEFYDASDLAGLIYHNVLLENRIRRYPAFLSLAEQQEFQDLGNDAQFQNLWQSGPTLNDLLNYPKVKAMVNNPVMVANLKKIVGGNLKDLREFLEHGTSEKFKNEKILGRWLINTDASSAAYRRSRKDITPVLANATIAKMRRDYGGTVFIAGPDANMARLKVEAEAPGANPQQTLKATGTWSGENGSYSVSLTADDKTENSPIKLENDNRLSMTRAGFPLVFDREL